MLRLRIQERETREAEIKSNTASLLARNASLDDELTEETAEFITMKEIMPALGNKEQGVPP